MSYWCPRLKQTLPDVLRALGSDALRTAYRHGSEHVGGSIKEKIHNARATHRYPPSCALLASYTPGPVSLSRT